MFLPVNWHSEKLSAARMLNGNVKTWIVVSKAVLLIVSKSVVYAAMADFIG
jgi:hypothetical protein